MVGFYGGEPLEYAGITEQGTDAVPSSTGQVLGASFSEGLAHNLTPRLIRSQGRFAAETGVVLGGDPFGGGQPFMMEPETPIDAETAEAEFGIKGHLKFDAPIARSIAKDLSDHKREQLIREDVIARREGGLMTGGAARFTMNLAASLLDPINVAAAFIPIVGPAREAALIAQAGSAAARAGTRAWIGAGAGAVGTAALQPLEFGLSRQEREDYTMADALRNIALGTVLGGGLHSGIGAVVDRATGRFRNPLTQQLEDAGPEARETLLRGALAQTIEGRPVDVAPMLDAVDAIRIGDEGAARGAAADAFAAARRGAADEMPVLGPEAERAAVRPSETLEDIRTQIAELERMERPAAEPEPVGAAEPGRAAQAEAPRSEADVAMEIAEARASAVERAAFCITRGG